MAKNMRLSARARLDEVLKEYREPKDLETIFKRLKEAMVAPASGAAITQHLAFTRGEEKPEHQTNQRNSSNRKRIRTDQVSPEIGALTERRTADSSPN